MKAKTASGADVDIDINEVVRLATAAGWVAGEKQMHEFIVGGNSIKMTEQEMKAVADYWWEHYGKSDMLEYAKKMQHKAAKHIAAAFGYDEKPKNEDEVKAAIGHALEIGSPCLISEVVFEAVEWANSYFTIRNIEG
jgi:hypothetical protein